VSSLGKRLVAGPLTAAGIAAGHALLLALGGTWRLRFTGREHVDAARRLGGGAVLYALSHGVLLPLAYAYRERGVYLMISESRDGEIITRVTEALGYGVVRGSTTRGGGRAALRLAARGRSGYDLAITPDGPRGPRGVVGPGTVLVAARSGVPVVPLSVGADRAWRARSWDHFLVPKPGARVVVNYQPAIRVARGGDEAADAEAIRAALIRAEQTAQAQAGGTAPLGRAVRIPA
jgi:lysophospholipid acyltransferase (LPLAT)-like uncharacterized protein